MYSEFARDSLAGITVYCEISDRTVTYSVAYTVDIGGFAPMLLCEPINRREVHLYLGDLRHQVQLPYQRSVELLKNSSPRQYERFVIRQREYIKRDAIAKTIVTSSFVEWKIIFGNFACACLAKYTPDVTGRYRKDSNWSEKEFQKRDKQDRKRYEQDIGRNQRKFYKQQQKRMLEQKRDSKREWRETEPDLKKEDLERLAKNQQ
jgi:hypothetical protein